MKKSISNAICNGFNNNIRCNSHPVLILEHGTYACLVKPHSSAPPPPLLPSSSPSPPPSERGVKLVVKGKVALFCPTNAAAADGIHTAHAPPRRQTVTFPMKRREIQSGEDPSAICFPKDEDSRESGSGQDTRMDRASGLT